MSGAKPRVEARAQLASYASTIRGGRSGPSVVNAPTLCTTAMNTVGLTSGVGTDSTVHRMALAEQQDAQALHLWWSAWICLAGAATLGEAKASSSDSAAMGL